MGDNFDLIAGHSSVEQLKERLNSRRRREYIFGKWLALNEEELSKKYDYIVIDTENDEGILTQNALIVSDLVLGVAEASKDSFLALVALKKFVKELNDDFNSEIKLALIANKINLSENASKDLLAELQSYPEYLGYLPRRTRIADDKAVFSTTDEVLKEQLRAIFEKVIEVV